MANTEMSTIGRQTREIVDNHDPQSVVQQTSALDLSPRHKFQVMSVIAEEAAKAIKAAGFTTKIQNRDYVQVEGWSMIGLAWGCCARERDVHYEEGLGWVAHVDICRLDTGAVVGGASHVVGDDEKVWASRDTYAKRSMAVTRATGKAFRMMFSATVKMAGYEPTPAEEMSVEPVEEPKPKRTSKKKPGDMPKAPSANPDSGAIQGMPGEQEGFVKLIEAAKTDEDLDGIRQAATVAYHDGRLSKIEMEVVAVAGRKRREEIQKQF